MINFIRMLIIAKKDYEEALEEFKKDDENYDNED